MQRKPAYQIRNGALLHAKQTATLPSGPRYTLTVTDALGQISTQTAHTALEMATQLDAAQTPGGQAVVRNMAGEIVETVTWN
jgi:hypothetical protein